MTETTCDEVETHCLMILDQHTFEGRSTNAKYTIQILDIKQFSQAQSKVPNSTETFHPLWSVLSTVVRGILGLTTECLAATGINLVCYLINYEEIRS